MARSFTEALAAGTIPVIVSDGIELPFATLLEWSSATIFITQAEIDDFGYVISRLCSMSVESRMTMQRTVSRIYQRCFATHSARARCLAAALANQRGDQRPALTPTTAGAAQGLLEGVPCGT